MAEHHTAIPVAEGDAVQLRSLGEHSQWGLVVRTGRAEAEEAEYNAGTAIPDLPLNEYEEAELEDELDEDLSGSDEEHSHDEHENNEQNDEDKDDDEDDWESASEESPDEEEMDAEFDEYLEREAESELPPLKPTEVRVSVLPTGKFHVVEEEDLIVMDRYPEHGDIVQRVFDGSGAPIPLEQQQLGTVLDLTIEIDACLVGDSTLDHIEERQLLGLDARTDFELIHSLPNNLIVSYNGWIGSVDSYSESVIVVFDPPATAAPKSKSGKPKKKISAPSVYVLNSDTAYLCESLDEKVDREANMVTEQRLHFYPGQRLYIPSYAREDAERLSGPRTKQQFATVVDVELTAVGCRWLVAVTAGAPKPDELMFGEDLKLLKPFLDNEYANLRIGDYAYYKGNKLKGRSNGQPRDLPVGYQIDAELDRTCKMDSRGVEHMAVYNASSEGLALVRIDRTRTTMKVQWQNGEIELGVRSTDVRQFGFITGHQFLPGHYVQRRIEDDEVLSDYDAIYSLGIVEKVDVQNRTCWVKWMSPFELDPRNVTEAECAAAFASFSGVSERAVEVPVYELADADFPQPECGAGFAISAEVDVASHRDVLEGKTGGVIVGACPRDGLVYVRWVEDGSFAALRPIDIMLLESLASDVGEEQFAHADEVEQERLEMNKIKSGIALKHAAGSVDRALQNLTMDDSDLELVTPVPTAVAAVAAVGSSSQMDNAVDECPSSPTPPHIHNAFWSVDAVLSDHAFAQEPSKLTNMKAVQREIKLLSSGLPTGIVACSYEDRMDLYSACIFGPKETPYEAGTFVFDLFLPAEFPNVPPKVFYHSRCMGRLNPNLYEDGKVCLSLLGTWNGVGEAGETWNKDSSIVQVLVSIQALILVQSPYFNEPGYELQRGSPEATERARIYNESAFLKSLESAVSMVKKPAQVFRDIIHEHYRINRDHIIAYLERVGHNETKLDFPLLPASNGFQVTLNKLKAKLAVEMAQLNSQHT